MHPECERFVATAIESTFGACPAREAVEVLDIGGSDINGTLRHLLPWAKTWRVLDPNDEHADYPWPAEDWREHVTRDICPPPMFDVVLCTEVLEHTPNWREVVRTCFLAARPGGLVVITAAAPPRAPHGARTPDGTMSDGEWYENIEPAELADLLDRFGQQGRMAYDAQHGDVGVCVPNVQRGTVALGGTTRY